MKMQFILGAAALALLPAAGLAERIYAVDEVGNLIRFDSATPGVIESSVPLTGLELDSFRSVGAIDFRPATGRLYALVDQRYGIPEPPPGALHGDLYLVDPGAGACSLIGIAYEVIGMYWGGGFAFSPVDDDIRIFGGDASNLRMNPNTAEVSVETPLAPQYFLAGLAFDHSEAGATASTLYGLDYSSQNLVRIGGVDGVPPPSGGEATVIGSLGVPFSGFASFDISPSGTAYAVLSPETEPGVPEPSQLYTVNLETGAATLMGAIGPLPGLHIFAMAVAPEGDGQGVIEIPALGPWGLFFLTVGVGVAGMLRLRRLRPARR